MLRLKGNLRGLRLVSKSISSPRPFSAKRSNEVVVSEVKNLANVALKLYSQRDLETQVAFLEALREEELNKKFIVNKFIKKNRDLASTWLPMWICKAVVLEDPKDHVKLFPVAVPVDNIELASTVKKDLVNVLVQLRAADTRTSSELLSAQAADLVDALAKRMNIDHLRDTTMVLQNFVSGSVVPTVLHSDLLEKGGLFADAIAPILQFAELNLPALHKKKFLALEKSRTALHDRLVEELTHLLHVVYRNRFHEGTPGPSPAVEEENQAHVPHAQKESYFIREPRIVKSLFQKDSFDYHIEHPRDGGMVYVRKESQNAGKIRFGDSYVLSVKAPCYARKRKPNEPGIYDDLNEMIASKVKTSKPSKTSAAALGSVSADSAEEDSEDDSESEEEDEDEEREGQWQRKVVIDNLPETITAAELRHALRKCGPVAKVWLYRDERTSPEEVRHMQAQMYSQAVKQKVKTRGCDADSTEIVDPEVDLPAMLAADDNEEGGVAVSGQEAAVHAAEQQLLPTKHKMLRGSTKTDSYAFVQMADEEGFRKITKDAVRLFGIQIQDKSCRVLMAQTYKSFWVDVGQNHSVAEAIYSLNEMFDGHFECYSEKEFEKLRPIYLQMSFEDAVECQRAFELLLRRMEDMQRAGVMFERHQWDRHGRRWERLHANLYPSWIKDSWYKENFDRQSKHMEKREAGRQLQASHNAAQKMSSLTLELEEEMKEEQGGEKEGEGGKSAEARAQRTGGESAQHAPVTAGSGVKSRSGKKGTKEKVVPVAAAKKPAAKKNAQKEEPPAATKTTATAAAAEEAAVAKRGARATTTLSSKVGSGEKNAVAAKAKPTAEKSAASKAASKTIGAKKASKPAAKADK